MQIYSIILFVLLCLPVLASGQDTQVPLDNNGKVFVITKAMQARYRLINATPDFEEARLYRDKNNTFWLEVTSANADGSRLRDRISMSESAVIELRDRVTALDAGAVGDSTTAPTSPMPPTQMSGLRMVESPTQDWQSGRTGLLVGTTIWGLYYGQVVGGLLSLRDSSLATGVTVGLAVGGAVGYALPAVLTANAPVSDASREMALGGLF
jgi:hypothetical protein